MASLILIMIGFAIKMLFFCEHCGNKTKYKLIHKRVTSLLPYYKQISEYSNEHFQKVLLCENCEKYTIRETWQAEIDAGTDDSIPPTYGYTIDDWYQLYPVLPVKFEYLPYDIESKLKELCKMKSRYRKNFLVELRKFLESLVDFLIEKENLELNGPLHTKIEDLSRELNLPGSLKRSMLTIKKLGNIDAHEFNKINQRDREDRINHSWSLVNYMILYFFQIDGILENYES